MNSAITQLLQRTLHGVADMRRAAVAREGSADDNGQRAQRAVAGYGKRSSSAAAQGGTKCTPCAAAAYVQKSRAEVQKMRGV